MPGNAAGRPPLKVALVMPIVGDLSGSGGAERHFGQLHDHFQTRGDVHTVLITARSAVGQLRLAGCRLGSHIRALPLGDRVGAGKLRILWMTALLLWATLQRELDVVHLCLPSSAYIPYAAVLSMIPRRLRPRLSITIVDCTVAPNLEFDRAADVYERQVVVAHRRYFKWCRFDGVYSWYQEFLRVARSLELLPDRTLMVAARYCFTDTRRFQPSASKQPVIVYAGRFSNQKRPLLFVEAVNSLLRRHPGVVDRWRFEMYGTGPLEPAVRDRIRELGLQHRVELTSTPDMAPVFARSRLFVSTQAFENFTSLAMLEAMASGNAVIAENVGQTSEFVKHRENGLLIESADPDAFADAMADYMNHTARHESMATASRRLATEVQTIEHFATDISDFWRQMSRT